MFEFHIELSEADYLEYNKFHLYHSKAGKRTILQNRIIVPAIFAFLTIILLLFKANSTLIIVEMIFGIFLSIVGIIEAPKIAWKAVLVNIEELKKNGKLPFDPSQTLLFTEEEIIDTTPTSVTKTKYQTVEAVYESENAVYIYLNATEAYTLPNKVFSDEKERAGFIEFINNKINK